MGDDRLLQVVSEELGVLPNSSMLQHVKLLLCVEGIFDVEALGALSRALHKSDTTLPDLQNDTRVAFVPLGGGALKHWVEKRYLKNLNLPEVHIYDNDVAKYREVIEQVNARNDGSWGVLTKKREIENYLHP